MPLGCGNANVTVEETDYVSSLLTDQLAWRRISERSTGYRAGPPIEKLNGYDSFVTLVDGRFSLLPLAGTQISNQIGASTFAFSSDGYLMVVGQNRLNQQSAGMLAPSGSGSLDWDDVTASGGADLWTLVEYGAERELREECMLQKHEHDGHAFEEITSEVKIFGFARMLHRAGKPEFFCMGRIEETGEALCMRGRERYVFEVQQAPVEPAVWGGQVRASAEVRRIGQEWLSALRKPGQTNPPSYPLEHGLELLVEICEDPEAAAVDDFMDQPWGS